MSTHLKSVYQDQHTTPHDEEALILYGYGRECERKNFGAETMTDIFHLFELPENRNIGRFNHICNTLEYLVDYSDVKIFLHIYPNLFKHLMMYHLTKDNGEDLSKMCEHVTRNSGEKCTYETIFNILNKLVDFIKEESKKEYPSLAVMLKYTLTKDFNANDKEEIYNIFCDLVDLYVKKEAAKQKTDYYDEMPKMFMFKPKKSKRTRRAVKK